MIVKNRNSTVHFRENDVEQSGACEIVHQSLRTYAYISSIKCPHDEPERKHLPQEKFRGNRSFSRQCVSREVYCAEISPSTQQNGLPLRVTVHACKLIAMLDSIQPTGTSCHHCIEAQEVLRHPTQCTNKE
jgi:hypothetical protein